MVFVNRLVLWSRLRSGIPDFTDRPPRHRPDPKPDERAHETEPRLCNEIIPEFVVDIDAILPCNRNGRYGRGTRRRREREAGDQSAAVVRAERRDERRPEEDECSKEVIEKGVESATIRPWFSENNSRQIRDDDEREQPTDGCDKLYRVRYRGLSSAPNQHTSSERHQQITPM